MKKRIKLTVGSKSITFKDSQEAKIAISVLASLMAHHKSANTVASTDYSKDNVEVRAEVVK